MGKCAVLRCQAPSDVWVELHVELGDPPHGIALCIPHRAQMDVAPWYLDGRDNVIYLGDDMTAQGLRRLVGMSKKLSHDRCSDAPDESLSTWTLSVEKMGTREREDIEILMTSKLRQQLRMMLGDYTQGDHDGL